MQLLDADQVRARAPLPGLIDCLEQAFRRGATVPPRLDYSPPGGDGGRHFLVMPAFDPDGTTAVKLVTYLPDNPARGLPTIQAVVAVFSSEGAPLALIDGTMVTRLRTAAASALASRYLSRPDSERLTLVGTGAQAPWMAAAHAVVRPIGRIDVWGRRPERVQATIAAIREIMTRDVDIHAAPSLEDSVRSADVVSCATSSAAPLVAGRWLQPGVFVDLVGSFTPTAREADDETVRRARIFVDTFEGALAEAGDLLDPIARGVIGRESIEGELASLVRGEVSGRRTPDEITLFKSVGTAIEDLAAARLALGTGG
jgi:ornithine cyclodeaminase